MWKRERISTLSFFPKGENSTENAYDSGKTQQLLLSGADFDSHIVESYYLEKRMVYYQNYIYCLNFRNTNAIHVISINIRFLPNKQFRSQK